MIIGEDSRDKTTKSGIEVLRLLGQHIVFIMAVDYKLRLSQIKLELYSIAKLVGMSQIIDVNSKIVVSVAVNISLDQEGQVSVNISSHLKSCLTITLEFISNCHIDCSFQHIWV